MSVINKITMINFYLDNKIEIDIILKKFEVLFSKLIDSLKIFTIKQSVKTINLLSINILKIYKYLLNEYVKNYLKHDKLDELINVITNSYDDTKLYDNFNEFIYDDPIIKIIIYINDNKCFNKIINCNNFGDLVDMIML